MPKFKFTRESCLDNWQRTLWDSAQEEIKERVRGIHTPINGPADDITCSECAIDENNYPQYPCPTIKALDGEQE